MKLKQNDDNLERRTCGLSGTHTNQPLVAENTEKRGMKYVLDQTARNTTSKQAAEVGMYVCFTTMHRPWNHNGQQSTASRGTRPSLFSSGKHAMLFTTVYTLTITEGPKQCCTPHFQLEPLRPHLAVSHATPLVASAC